MKFLVPEDAAHKSFENKKQYTAGCETAGSPTTKSVLKVRMSFDSGTSLLGIYPMEVTMGVRQDLTIRMVITILFTTAKIRNNQKYGD